MKFGSKQLLVLIIIATVFFLGVASEFCEKIVAGSESSLASRIHTDDQALQGQVAVATAAATATETAIETETARETGAGANRQHNEPFEAYAACLQDTGNALQDSELNVACESHAVPFQPAAQGLVIGTEETNTDTAHDTTPPLTLRTTGESKVDGMDPLHFFLESSDASSQASTHQTLRIGSILGGGTTNVTSSLSDDDRRRNHWEICNLILGSLFIFLFFLSFSAIWYRILFHCIALQKGKRMGKKLDSEWYAFKFHLPIIFLITISSICGIAGSFGRAYAFEWSYGWRLFLSLEFLSMMFFFNSVLCITIMWSALVTKTFKKDWYRKWSSRLCSGIWILLVGGINALTLGLTFFFLLPIPGINRFIFQLTVAIFICILSLLMSVSNISYGVILLCYFRAKRVRKVVRLSIITFLTTTSFFVLCILNLFTVVINRARYSTPRLLSAGPFVYLVSFSFCHVFVCMGLVFFLVGASTLNICCRKKKAKLSPMGNKSKSSFIHKLKKKKDSTMQQKSSVECVNMPNNETCETADCDKFGDSSTISTIDSVVCDDSPPTEATMI